MNLITTSLFLFLLTENISKCNNRQIYDDDEGATDLAERFFYPNYAANFYNNRQTPFANQHGFPPAWSPFLPSNNNQPFPSWQNHNFFMTGNADSSRNSIIDADLSDLSCGAHNNNLFRRKRGDLDLSPTNTTESGDDYDNDDRIVGGYAVDIADWPWQVSLRYNGRHLCGGAIINNRYVLTAAHCFTTKSTNLFRPNSLIDDDSINEWSVYVAKSKLALGELGELGPLDIESIQIHPNYNKLKKFDSDLALVRLKLPLKFSDKVFPICLPKQGSFAPIGNDCFVTGYGRTKGTGGNGFLKAAQVPILPSNQCGTATQQFHLTHNMLCAGYLQGGVGSCQGDSGGPLSCRFPGGDFLVLHGLVSFGYECAARYQPSVHVRVANFIHWIKQAIVNDHKQTTVTTTSTTTKQTSFIDDFDYFRNGNLRIKDGFGIVPTAANQHGGNGTTVSQIVDHVTTMSSRTLSAAMFNMTMP